MRGLRLSNDEFRAAVRAFFDSIPVERLRALALKMMADPFTDPRAQPRRGRPRRGAEEDGDEGKVVSLHQRNPRRRRRKAVAERDVDEEQAVSLHPRKNGRRRRRKAVDAAAEAKLAERRKRNAANARARRAAKAAKGGTAPIGGNGTARTPSLLWSLAR
jgi:hypothetical protein